MNCSFFPDDPGCKNSYMTAHYIMSSDIHRERMWANITYTMVAAANFFYTVFSLFRYNTESTWEIADKYGFNYIKWNSMLRNNGGLVIWGVAFITQMLANFGMITDINMIAWGWGVALMGMFVYFSAQLLIYAGHEHYFSLWKADTSATDADDLAGLFNAARFTIWTSIAMHTAAIIPLAKYRDVWVDA